MELSTVKLTGGSIPPSVGVVGREISSRPTKRACGTIWPNGEFGLGYAPKVEPADAPSRETGSGHSAEWVRAGVKVWAEDGAKPLDLTSPPNSHKQTNRPESYGRKGLSGYGGKFIRNAGFLLQQRYTKRRLTFLTLTLPPLAFEPARLVAETWGDTVRQLLQHLSRLLERAGLPPSIASVTELQTKRLESGDVACLHLHLVFVGRHAGGAWCISPKQVRVWWLKRLSRVTGGTVESMNCVDMKAVKRDAGNYLSKYMSKGSEHIERYAEQVGWGCVPSQWWNVTKSMRHSVKSRCLSSDGCMELLECMVQSFFDCQLEGVFKFVRCIEVQATEYQSFVVGFWGKLEPGQVEQIRGMVSSYLGG